MVGYDLEVLDASDFGFVRLSLPRTFFFLMYYIVYERKESPGERWTDAKIGPEI